MIQLGAAKPPGEVKMLVEWQVSHGAVVAM